MAENTARTVKDLSFTEADRIRISQQNGFLGVTKPVTVRIFGTNAATAANYTAPFFIADRSYEVLSVTERHETAGSAGGSVTLMVKKVASGTAPASGVDVLSAGIDLKATANTNQSGTIIQTRTSNVYNKTLTSGDALALVTTGTLTSVAGVTVSVLLRSL